MKTTLFEQALAELEARDPPTLAGAPLDDPPPEPGPRRRGRQRATGLALKRQTVSLAEGYSLMKARALEYLQQEHPAHALLLSFVPGGGKTHLGVWLAEHLAAQGKRVIYVAPRHDFWDDVQAISQSQGGHPEWWYHWLPRQLGDEDADKPQTCRYEPQISRWLHRGYEAMTFCQKICGWDYIRNHCPYHEQKDAAENMPILFCQHQHLTSGHPLLSKAQVIIGDENPLSVFPDDWRIPAKYVCPDDLGYEHPLTELLIKLAHVVFKTTRDGDGKPAPVSGPALLDALGGAASVLETCESFDLAYTSELLEPSIWYADQVDEIGYFHLPDLCRLLIREAREALEGREYLDRVIAVNGELHLLRRRIINPETPRHVVWLDATANEHLYQTIFQRPIELVRPQVELAGTIRYLDASLNTKSAMLEQDGSVRGEKLGKLNQQIGHLIEQRGYQQPVVISHKAAREWLDLPGREYGHFGGERGTNRFETCDAAFVVGAQQPGLDEIIKQARMIYIERMAPFQTDWITVIRPFVGVDYAHPVSVFADADLNHLLWQYREAEIIQAAHRVRPARRPVDVWLLLNLPIDELAPSEVLNLSDIFSVPHDPETGEHESVDPYMWGLVTSYAQGIYEANDILAVSGIMEMVGCKERAARNYYDLILKYRIGGEWQSIQAAVPKRRGRPPKAAKPAI